MVIFPRYHQWDAVLKLEADAEGQRCRAELPDPALGRVGQVEHHRLDRPSALERCTTPTTTRSSTRSIVITDRVDPGPPAPGDDLPVRARPGRGREDRQGLHPARRGAGREQARIIITTLQKFPFVLDKIGRAPEPPLRRHRRRGPLLPDRRGGQGPAAGARGHRRAGADRGRGGGRRLHRRGHRSGRGGPRQGRRCRGKQANLSFFAFTATPKARTLEMFGTLGPGGPALRALPPLLDAPGHRGGLHPGRARELHDLPDLLADREGHRR